GAWVCVGGEVHAVPVIAVCVLSIPDDCSLLVQLPAAQPQQYSCPARRSSDLVNTMVPVALEPVQLVPVYQVAVPEVPEVAVNKAPGITPVPPPATTATAMTLAAPTQRPPMQVRAALVIERSLPLSATSSSI